MFQVIFRQKHRVCELSEKNTFCMFYLDGSPPDFLAHQGCHYILGQGTLTKCSGTPGGCQDNSACNTGRSNRA